MGVEAETGVKADDEKRGHFEDLEEVEVEEGSCYIAVAG
jgi:hypothetical protein